MLPSKDNGPGVLQPAQTSNGPCTPNRTTKRGEGGVMMMQMRPMSGSRHAGLPVGPLYHQGLSCRLMQAHAATSTCKLTQAHVGPCRLMQAHAGSCTTSLQSRLSSQTHSTPADIIWNTPNLLSCCQLGYHQHPVPQLRHDVGAPRFRQVSAIR